MTDITIPPEALEAAARALADAYYRHCSDDRITLADTDDTPEDWMNEARAACLAMLRAWPGMWEQHITSPALNRPLSIILPLPQENTND